MYAVFRKFLAINGRKQAEVQTIADSDQPHELTYAPWPFVKLQAEIRGPIPPVYEGSSTFLDLCTLGTELQELNEEEEQFKSVSVAIANDDTVTPIRLKELLTDQDAPVDTIFVHD